MTTENLKKLIIMLVLTLSVSATAEAVEARIDGLWYNLSGDIAEVIYYNNYMYEYKGDIVIPQTVEYKGNTYSVKRIRDHAFYECGSMTSITIPSSVESIGYMAFGGCKSLTAVHITDLEAWLKIDFSSTDSAPLSYAHHLFLNGEEVKDLVIPEGVTTIKMMAFYGWSALNSITIPSSLKSIGQWAFSGCSGLTAVHITDLEAWCRIDFKNPSNPLQQAHHLFLNGEEVKELVVPSSLTSIGDRTFQGCSGLMSLTIPSSVTNIGESAFSGCSGLTSLTIPESVKSIQGWAFYQCNGLDSLTIPANIAYIGENAFAGCSSLDNVVIPGNVKQLSNRAFAGCDFKSITIGEGVTSIGDKVFEGCINLSSINIPSTVTAIGEDAFKNCNGLRKVHISDLAAWCNIAFGGVYSNPLCYARRLFLNGTEVKDLVIPSGITSIRDWAFYECVELASVTLQDGVTSIGASAFRNCRRITSITIPTSVTTIGDHAFCECNEVASITIPEGVTSIGMYAFARCWLVTSITIPNSVTTIGSTAFYECSRLNTLTIGSGVKHIDFRAFSDCMRLTDVYCLAETVPEKSNAYQIFYGSTINNATLHVPDASVEAYRAEKPWSDFKSIVGLSDVTGIASAAADDSPLQVESHDGVLTIRGVGEGTPISVYDLAGRCVTHTTACGAATTVSTPFKVGATAIVRIGSVAEQVVMR